MNKKIKCIALTLFSVLLTSNLMVPGVHATTVKTDTQSKISTSLSSSTFSTSAKTQGSSIYAKITSNDGSFSHRYEVIAYFYDKNGKSVDRASNTLSIGSSFSLYLYEHSWASPWTYANVEFHADGTLVATEKVFK